jgi:dTDP-4-amino-4,6-dideoxygalactose transaminase
MNGQEVGTQGDFIALSFSQDKMIDAVSGGALIIRNPKFNNMSKFVFKKVSLLGQVRDHMYPLLTFKIRKTYGSGLGKGLHFILKKLGLLSQPLIKDLTTRLHSLPDWYCSLINYQFNHQDDNLEHRKQIADIYTKNLNRQIIISKSAIMRFPILLEKRTDMIRYLKSSGIYVSDIWYDAPVAPNKFLKLTDYHGECPIAESYSDQILNLPTHINVSLKQAEYISHKINTWLNIH